MERAFRVRSNAVVYVAADGSTRIVAGDREEERIVSIWTIRDLLRMTWQYGRKDHLKLPLPDGEERKKLPGVGDHSSCSMTRSSSPVSREGTEM